jgi:hypothetical protein
LAAWLASGILRAHRVGAVQSVAGWWLAAVGAVFVEASLQLGDATFRRCDTFLELVDDLANDIHHGIQSEAEAAWIKGRKIFARPFNNAEAREC